MSGAAAVPRCAEGSGGTVPAFTFCAQTIWYLAGGVRKGPVITNHTEVLIK